MSGYQIYIEGHPNGQTVISGAMVQTALHGILNRIRDLSLTHIIVQRMDERRVKMEISAKNLLMRSVPFYNYLSHQAYPSLSLNKGSKS